MPAPSTPAAVTRTLHAPSLLDAHPHLRANLPPSPVRIKKVVVQASNRDGQVVSGEIGPHATHKLAQGRIDPLLCTPHQAGLPFVDAFIANMLVHTQRAREVAVALSEGQARTEQIMTLEHMHMLCEACKRELAAASAVCVPLLAPVRVFGDLHGQLVELLDLFALYGSPNHLKGDVEEVNYLFVGDFVDRGPCSLEVALLLMALKVRYPRFVHLVRGNHEDRAVNAHYGFRAELTRKLGQERGEALWGRMNDVFDWLPIAANIDESILCVHGGIGSQFVSLSQLDKFTLPIRPADLPPDLKQVYWDIMWSDPCDQDQVVGEHASPRGANITLFSAQRVVDFLSTNHLQMIIRAHQCVVEGWELFAGGRLITVFSAARYCNSYTNKGAVLTINRHLEVRAAVMS